MSCRLFRLAVVVNIFLGYVYALHVSQDGKELFELSLIHINDFHARFEQTGVGSGTCHPGEEDTCVGGIARIVTAVKDLVKTRPNAVFLNAGDNFQGTMWYTKFKWNVTAQFLNMLPHDALELSSTGKLKFSDEIETVTAEAANLKAQGVDIIIGLSHSGLDVDREVAASVPDLDVIVGGHSHTFLYTGTPPSTEFPEDSYPVIVEQTGGRKVLIVQAYAYSKYVGNITVWFDGKGEFAAWEGRPILLDKNVQQGLYGNTYTVSF
ncbi:Apyrase [Blattella germanica]|nr:Apyrase [Blattella germanica]